MTASRSRDVLSDYSLLVVGRNVATDGDAYYVSRKRWALLRELARPFADATYFPFQGAHPSGSLDDLARIDESLLRVRANESLMSSGTGNPATLLQKVADLFGDGLSIRDFSDADVVTYTFYPGIYPMVLAPFILTTGDLNVGYFGADAAHTAEVAYSKSVPDRAKSALYTATQRYILNNLDIALVRDPSMKDKYAIEGSFVESKPVLKYPIDDIRFEVPERLQEPVRLLFVASFRPEKGIRYLVDAFETLVTETDTEYRLRLVGDGAVRSDVERAVESLGVDDSVEFTGYIHDADEMMAQYEESDIFVLPSLTEGFPRVLNESMAFGLPIVSTNIGGIPSVLEHRRSAMLVQPRDPDAIQESVREIVADDELRTRLVTNAREKIDAYPEGTAGEQHLDAISRHLRSR